MRNVLILDDDSALIFTFLNYLLGNHANIYRKVQGGTMFDCVIVDAKRIYLEDPTYLITFRNKICNEKAEIIAISEHIPYLQNRKVQKFSTIRSHKSIFTTLNEPEVLGLFCVMWNKSISWNKKWC
jgi:hypothetical protein